MTDFQVRSDNVDVEQIMRQIRSRIREKRGVDYTEEEIKELARVKLEKFLDPTGVRSDLLAQFRRANSEGPARNYKFEDTTLFESSRGWLRAVRKMLNPILKLFFNPNPLIDALHIQAELNETTSRRGDLQYELVHNLVLETTRLGIQVKNLKMQVESMSSRLDFDERRARALEGVVQYRPGAVPPLQPPISSARRESREESTQERRTRRRRRRGRRPASARDEAGGSGYGEAGSASARDEAGGSGYGEASASARRDSDGGFGGTGADAHGDPDAGVGATRSDSAPEASQSSHADRAERHEAANSHNDRREPEPVAPKPLDLSRGAGGEPHEIRGGDSGPDSPKPLDLPRGEGG